MPFEPVPVTTEDLTTYLTDNHGESVGVPELLGAVRPLQLFSCNGKETSEGSQSSVLVSGTLLFRRNLRRTSKLLLLSLPLNRTLSPKKMIPSSSLVTLTIFAKLFSPESFIPRSLRVFRVTVKRSPLNKKLVQRWVGNSSASTSQ